MTKPFSLAAILSLTTGRLLCNFSDMHALAEWVAGHPIWTHEFADQESNQKLREAIWRQHPDLQAVDASGVTSDNYLEFVAQNEQQFGLTLEIEQGNSEQTESPLASLERMMPDKPVVAVVVPESC